MTRGSHQHADIKAAIPGTSDVMLTRRRRPDETRSVSCRWFHARARVAFRAEEFDGRMEVVSDRAFDFDNFNRPVG